MGTLFKASALATCLALGLNVATAATTTTDQGATGDVTHGDKVLRVGCDAAFAPFTYTDDNCSNGGNVLFNCFPYSKQTGDGQKLAWKLGRACFSASDLLTRWQRHDAASS